MITAQPAQKLVAYLLVTVLRQYVAKEPLFLSEAFGDDVYELMAALTTIATGDPDADRRYWNSLLYDENELCLQ